MDKKTEHITVHLSETRKLQIKRLAEANSTTPSELIGSLIDDHLNCEFVRFRVMQEVFSFEGTNEGDESRAG